MTRSQPPPHIVGIGASAGGLAAFKSFLENTPADTGMAFVLVQHLDPVQKSLLVELLGAAASMPVVVAEDGVAVEPNCVFVIPPNATLTIKDGVLKLETPAPERQFRRPIDSFFVSLAEDQGERAIGIILSGVGSDGSLGIRSIKEHGGLTLAQAEFNSTALSGMPRSAAATGMVDQVLAVEAMPAKLIDYYNHLSEVAELKDGVGNRKDVRQKLSEVTALLHAGVRHDFSGYKETTLVRRVQRRMQVLHVDNVADYLERLKTDPEEPDALFREVLIGVTEFFRDPEAFEALKSTAIKPLLAAKQPNDTVRVWVAGCSTGEEVYSIAILLKEVQEELRTTTKLDIKIFGTDIDPGAVSFARAGRYRGMAPGLSAERFERWFAQDGADHCPRSEIREMCVFSVHSLVKDPPFSRLDLISCRNLLIYLDNDLQYRAARTFHYALNAGGYLFLGTSESITRHGNLFPVLDRKHRILQRSNVSRAELPALQSAVALSRPQPELPSLRRASADEQIDKSVRRVMEHYAPAYFVINRDHEILRFSGSEARHYLEPSPGEANLHLFSLLHKTLRPAVRAAVQQALSSQEPVVMDNLAIRIDGRSRALTLIVEPIIESTGKEQGLCVVAFRDASPLPASGEQEASAPATDATVVTALEKELNATRAQLRAASDELETYIEDMKSTIEEFQAVNEELQSSNEELETAKEEMQSINEELQTVNSEMLSKNDLLTRLNSDLQNLLDSTQIATVFLDDELRIRHFTPALTELFPLRESDRGRPMTEIVNLLAYDDLKRDVAAVRSTQSVVEHEIFLQSRNATFLLRIRPYRTVKNVIDGVVLTFVDITERKLTEERMQLLSHELQHRNKNLFAVIASIATRSLSGNRSLDEAREVLTARLHALAAANALLMDDVTKGASVGNLVRRELESFSAHRVSIEGPRVMLTPTATQNFALVMHELATNAMKYGALSDASGTVAVRWSVSGGAGEEQRLSFHWQEAGGPHVHPPIRKGFGSTLLERAFDTDRPARFDWAPEGVAFHLDIPLGSVSAETTGSEVQKDTVVETPWITPQLA